jgi:succinate dehydrogenase / fumarate reductase iron-sulfur subunit
MRITLNVWRQKDRHSAGNFETHTVENVNAHMSFLEMLDVLNERLEKEGKEPVAFESDCREGICGSCGCMIDGQPHGPENRTTTCQLHMRSYKDGDTITLEPFRAKAFPVIKDLVVDRSSFDRIMQSGGYISVRTGAAQDANALPVPKDNSDRAMDAAECIGCGACVASCPNAAAMLYTGAKVSHLALLPQGQAERFKRVVDMVHTMDGEDFGHCTNFGECSAACPKGIPLDVISLMNGDLLKAQIKGRSN